LIYEQYFYDGHNKKKIAQDCKRDGVSGVFRRRLYSNFVNNNFIRSCTHIDGLPHSINDNPAIVWNGGARDWYDNGVMHRVTGPARVYSSSRTLEEEHREWTVRGKYFPYQKILDLLEHHQIPLNWREWSEGEKTIMRLALS
jgi:hypothetical protein